MPRSRSREAPSLQVAQSGKETLRAEGEIAEPRFSHVRAEGGETLPSAAAVLTDKDVHMPMPAHEIERLIKAKLPDARIELTDLAGDDDHWAAHVVSAAFRGLPRVRQHQLVYEALGGRMGEALHALQLTTAPPPD